MTKFEIMFDNLFIYMGGDDRWFKAGKEDAEYFMEKVLELEQDRKEWKHSQEAYKAEAEASRVLIKELEAEVLKEQCETLAAKGLEAVIDEQAARIKELEGILHEALSNMEYYSASMGEYWLVQDNDIQAMQKALEQGQ